ncbi:MAG: hypothetical protein ACJAVC_000390 [Brevundimonas sp.]|uniref:hypothetical protein n=1 Tax=Brevundimonas sp. GW460-12-10-14-LB2 TaxID=1827469 RepID=UPI0007BCC64C|nr:hypothetical protein [Brevundimonas sp. GW460-12-10-14-LB2]ANC53997.1 hypothetical protein A4249_10240 [Brevundimonas sp. GW460-12-10-14-LB2]MEA3472035.1 hypothetical protein [Pseudomonadota bacterium]
MRRALAVSIVLTAVNLAAGAAVAQQAPTNASGLRYLSWPGKPAVAARATPTPAVIQAEAPAPTVTAANRSLPGAIPLARLSPAPSVTPSISTPRSNGLTPASAWMPQRAPTPAEPAHSAPVEAAPVETAPAQATRVAPSPYVPEPQPSAPQPQPEPQMQAEPAPVPQQAAQAEPQPATQPAQAAVADPMAPRRDAPIYRLQRPQAGAPLDAAAVAASGQAAPTPTAGDNSARYYSVHRQAGRHPDAIPAPQQTYLDAMPVQMAQTPQSSDLAQPDGPPALIRNANGALRAVPQTEADNLP